MLAWFYGAHWADLISWTTFTGKKKRDICWHACHGWMINPKDTGSLATTEKRPSVRQWPQLTSSWFLLDDVRRSRKSCRGKGALLPPCLPPPANNGLSEGQSEWGKGKPRQKRGVNSRRRKGTSETWWTGCQKSADDEIQEKLLIRN